uniref:Mitochondrial carrier protein n=1 Tax=Rhodosorus marinus TaxID=101924 RepID=A0A6T6KH87_9RHOD|mmetsp:Transcript_12285/g.17831  ORF Transcript_12285/g.17831 Transcript_12285/m.17831 type:complete len:286 (+) Transcript_12285:114-971(+)
MSPPTGKGYKDVRNGAVLQMVEAASLGLPFEVWKTRMGRFRNEGNVVAFRNVYSTAGGGVRGVAAFWAGIGPKMFESATKGAVLMVAKESILEICHSAGMSPMLSGVVAGAGGGVCQTVVMGPCTYLVTAAVTGDKGKTMTQIISETWKAKGLKGFYPGGSAVAFRQATNWASRQGFTEGVRTQMKKIKYGDASAKLTPLEEAASGIIGGAFACWNHPFEVARIEMQARARAGEPALSMMGVFRMVYKDYGVSGLFKGIVPRLLLGIWQTLFMVSGANIIKERLK